MNAHGRASRSHQTASIWIGLFATAALGLFALVLGTSAAGQKPGSAEVSSQDTEPTFKLQVQRNVVLVRVVVHDDNGRPVGSLKKEDFQLFDNKKPQVITHFSVEIPSAKSRLAPAVATPQPATEPGSEAVTEAAPSVATPQRFVAMYFDDVHMEFGDIARTRDAATRYLASALTPGDRVGVFTASGQHALDFTDDRDKLRQALLEIFTRPIIPQRPDSACPQIFPYQAYLIVHENDRFAREIAGEEAYHCACESLPLQGQQLQQCRNLAEARAESEAYQVLNLDETQTQYALHGLEVLLRRIAQVPGQRTILLVSPGFLTMTQQIQLNEIADRALRSNVVINTLDSKGLYAPLPYGDVSKRPIVIARRPDLMGKKAQFQLDSLDRDSEVLRNLAEDTGGTFFHNSNDLDKGFREAGALPQVYYVLAFSPEKLKPDGRFHTLKVRLVSPGRYTVQARRGYFAPSKLQDSATEAKEELEQAVFSQDELNELPIEVHTQFFKASGAEATLSVLTHLDVRFVRFRKEDGRNLDNLTLVTVLFDTSGAYVTGRQKLIEFRLRDSSLEKLAHSGLNVKTSFDVKPGTYLVRQIVRDGGGAQISALNRSVEIPY